MGDVAVVFKILPTDSEVDTDKLKNTVESELKSVCEINKIEIQEIGFGLKAVRLEIIIPDEEGKIDAVESKITSVEGVGQVDTEEVTLI